MAKEQDQERSWMEKLKHTYRLVIMNNETFEEIGSYRLSLLNVYIALSTIVVVVALGVVTLIAFTPLRKYIPGYADVNQSQELYDVIAKLEDLERDMITHRQYTNNVRRVLVGEVETEEDVTKAELDSNGQTTAIEAVLPSEIDTQLRREVKMQKIGEIAQQGRTTNLSLSGVPLEQ